MRSAATTCDRSSASRESRGRGEALEPFAFAYGVAGCMRGSHHAPLIPVGLEQATPSRFDGPPRVVCLGFQVKVGEADRTAGHARDPAFDRARTQANEAMDYLRRHGPFEPHRMPLEDLEYTTMRDLERRLADRWQPVTEPTVTLAGAPADVTGTEVGAGREV